MTSVQLVKTIPQQPAEITLPHIFSDHMVLQQQQPIPIWGKAAPGTAVTVTFAGQTKTTVANEHGRWMVHLDALTATAVGQTLTITGQNTVTFTDVLVGEVWICSGQSNMQFGVSSSVNGGQEYAGAHFPHIRLFTVPVETAPAPREDCGGGWMVCSQDTVPCFSAVAFFFGRALHQQLHVPIGLIHSSLGGSVIESWTSAPVLREQFPEFTGQLDTLANLSDAELTAIEDYPQLVARREHALQIMFAREDDLAAAGKTAAADFDDRQWQTMPLPGDYTKLGLADVYGIIWFRKTIDLPAAWAGKEIILRLGPIDEVDNTWCNGQLVGGMGRSRTNETTNWNVPRAYHVPGSAVKAGENVLAVRVLNQYGAGGLWGAPAGDMYAEVADGSDGTRIPLSGDWRYCVEWMLPVLPPQPLDMHLPSVLYNAMLHPLIPYALQGAIWYQGESNAGNAPQYQKLLPAMIIDWRTRWHAGDFTFLIVQLANFMARTEAPVESGWAELRETQALTTTVLPKVGLAVAIDIGDANDIHPTNKQEVGRRLSLAACAIAYQENVAFSGPVFDKMTVHDDKVVLTFRHTDGGLLAKGDTLHGFAIRAADSPFVTAQAKIDGNQVLVWADGLAHPAAVRYAWANNPECNLYNGAGLPAVPFRTDGE